MKNTQNKRPTIVAVDFDGVLCKETYPNIGEPLDANMELIRSFKKAGAILILNTCRTDNYLEDALAWLEKHNLKFDYINENVPNQINFYGVDCRKISADIYIDDRAYNPIDPDFLTKIKEQLKMAKTEEIKTCCGTCIHKETCKYKEACETQAKVINKPFKLACDFYDEVAKVTFPKLNPPTITPDPMIAPYITWTGTGTGGVCNGCGHFDTVAKKCKLEGKAMGIVGLPCQRTVSWSTSDGDTGSRIELDEPSWTTENTVFINTTNTKDSTSKII